MVAGLHDLQRNVEQPSLLDDLGGLKGAVVRKQGKLELVVANVALIIGGLRGSQKGECHDVSSGGIAKLAVVQEGHPVAKF